MEGVILMNFFQLTMKILSGLLMIYFLLILLRVFLSWIPNISPGSNKIKTLINRFTDPYMNRFMRISWLRFGVFDFSPVLGLALLSLLLYLTQRLSTGGMPSAGELIILAIQLIWGLAAFLATLIGILMLIRLTTLYAVKGRPEWIDRLDRFLFPWVAKILGLFTSRTVAYPIALAICAVSLLAARFLIGSLLDRFIYPILLRL